MQLERLSVVSKCEQSYQIQRRINDNNFREAFEQKQKELYKSENPNMVQEMQKFIDEWDKRYKVTFQEERFKS